MAPGSAVITVTSGKLTAQCTVKCSWKAAEKPPESAKPSAPSQSTQDKLPAQEEKSVDLAAFFTKIEKDYDMSSHGGRRRRAHRKLLPRPVRPSRPSSWPFICA